jgi:death-on-curing protein
MIDNVPSPQLGEFQHVRQAHLQTISKPVKNENLNETYEYERSKNHPKNIFYYDQGDLFDMAAAYCFHIAQAQASKSTKKSRPRRSANAY